MSTFAYLFCYVALLVFVASVARKCLSFMNKPLQMRWELYPVPTEPAETFEHGGSYLEQVDWWKKERKHTFVGMAKYMAEEIICMKACYEHNRAIWYRTFPFHYGLYFVMVFTAIAFVIAICQLLGISAAPLQAINNIIGPVGLALTLFGAIALLMFRLSDSGLKKYSTAEQYLTLIIFIGISSICLLTWLTVDKDFSLLNTFIAGLISFKFTPVESGLMVASIVSVSFLTAVIPNTQMAHLFMKYFLYHDIRWGDTAASDNPGPVDRSLDIVLNYPVTWSADHVGLKQNKKTWVEVALFNPAAEPGKK
ncbi:MAG: respiratory nitrate reductase subunit gamma [Desulforhopalus sp.]|nr:respiratory nitrate reductase subunit gamma [Desulforhopalus sp.]